ncbi:MAG: UDP binding domain-containing protein [Candidatus Bathyarchaeia archaeon]|jgi:nucleotide sugar dehydrogenase
MTASISTILQVTPQDVDTSEKRSKYTVAVVGCGHKGIFLANAFADAGFNVVCTDANASVVKKAAKGKTAFAMPQAEAKLKSHLNADKITVVGELKKAVAQSDVVVIAITAKVDEKKKNDDNGLEGTCKQIGAALRQGALVIYGGIAGFGFIEETVKQLLENTSGFKAGQGYGLAYNPLLTTDSPIEKMELTVAADDQTSLQAASTILKALTKTVKEVGDTKTAEAATLFDIVKQDAETALTSELAVFCEAAGVDYFKALAVLGFDSNNFRPSILERANSDEAYFLLESAENLNTKLKLPRLARQINEDMTKQAVNFLAEALKSCNKTLRRGRIAVLSPATPAAGCFVRLLEQKGAKVVLCDPTAKKEALEGVAVRTSLNKTMEGADCIVVLSAQHSISSVNLKKIRALMKAPAVLVDLAGAFEPQTVNTEGFLYFGLGRGNDEK